jgi:hypothetical protein
VGDVLGGWGRFCEKKRDGGELGGGLDLIIFSGWMLDDSVG